jgi:hypothetical protein
MNKKLLRGAAKLALSKRFSDVRVGKAQGVIPGARLEYSDGGERKEAAVRTTNEREVGLLRDRSGEWRTLSKVQLVIVAVPSIADEETVDVIAFDPAQLKTEFEKVVKLTEKRSRSPNRFKAPVFLPLDPTKTKNRGALHSIIQWTEKIVKSEIPMPAETESVSVATKIEALRSSIAKGLGVNASDIELTISFKLVS